jgi:hypothetical protein
VGEEGEEKGGEVEVFVELEGNWNKVILKRVFLMPIRYRTNPVSIDAKRDIFRLPANYV